MMLEQKIKIITFIFLVQHKLESMGDLKKNKRLNFLNFFSVQKDYEKNAQTRFL